MASGSDSEEVAGLVKSPKMPFSVIPAKAGIQLFQDVLDPGFRGGDASRDFLRDHQVCLYKFIAIAKKSPN